MAVTDLNKIAAELVEIARRDLATIAPEELEFNSDTVFSIRRLLAAALPMADRRVQLTTAHLRYVYREITTHIAPAELARHVRLGMDNANADQGNDYPNTRDFDGLTRGVSHVLGLALAIAQVQADKEIAADELAEDQREWDESVAEIGGELALRGYAPADALAEAIRQCGPRPAAA